MVDKKQPEPVPEVLDGTATTEVIDPVAAPGAETGAQRTVVFTVEQPTKRRRWPWILLIVLVVLAGLLVAGFFIAEKYVREYAENYARDQIVAVLALPEDTPVAVTLGEGSIILQALSGAIGEVNVEAKDVTFGELTGDARITATKVPLDGTKPVETLDITVSIDEDNVRTLAGSLSGLELNSIELQDGVIAIGSEFNIFNLLVIPVAVDLAPAANGRRDHVRPGHDLPRRRPDLGGRPARQPDVLRAGGRPAQHADRVRRQLAAEGAHGRRRAGGRQRPGREGQRRRHPAVRPRSVDHGVVPLELPWLQGPSRVRSPHILDIA